jgi:16S rRNA (cytosine1402-N4)-methyltransferase
MQLDDPSRGFTCKADGPLDMRMNPARGVSATELLSTLDAKSLVRLLIENADEPRADELAKAILKSQSRQPITTTGSLADVVRSAIQAVRRSTAADAELAVRRVFQALRIAVNDEFGALEALLRQLPGCLKPGGRVAILTFHSGEDRRVKAAFKAGQRDGIYSLIANEVIRASREEQRANPRSTSAKLRFAIRSTVEPLP